MNWKIPGIILLIGVLAIGGRIAWRIHQQHQAANAPRAERAFDQNPDHYVLLRSSYVTDAASARQLIGQTIWVRVGYAYNSYPVAGGAIEKREPRLLTPLEPLKVTGVHQQRWEGHEGIFLLVDDGSHQSRAVEIGQQTADGPKMAIDNMFLFDDPHKLFNFWSPEIWKAVEQHQAIKGMSTMQINLSLGSALLLNDGGGTSPTYLFLRDHNPIVVTFHGDKVTNVRPPRPDELPAS